MLERVPIIRNRLKGFSPSKEQGSSSSPISVVFAGTPQLAVPSLHVLAHSEEVIAVITQPDRRSGRGKRVNPPPVKTSALSLGIPVYQPDPLSPDLLLQLLTELHCELLVVVAFGRILPAEVFSLPRLLSINLHPSLLPQYRGAAPIPRAIMEGERETGVTIQKVSAEVDSGPIILQKSFLIDADDTCGSLSGKLASEGATLLYKAVQLIKTGTFALTPQQGRVSLAPKITKETAKIDWSLPATRLHNLVRAMNPSPGAYTSFHRGKQRHRVKLWRSTPLAKHSASTSPGTVLELQDDKGFTVQAGQGSLLILETQVSGKRRMSACDFIRGYGIDKGSIFGD